MRPWLILFMACATCLRAQGVETTWLRLSVPFRIQEKDNDCTTGSLGSPLFVGIDTDAGKVVAARLGTGSQAKPMASRMLTPSEVAALETYEDSFHRIWLKALTLEEPNLVWVLNDLGNVLCSPRKPVVSVDGGPGRLYFDVDGLGDEYLVTYSNHLKLTGLRQDKLPYVIELDAVQKRYTKESRK